MSYDEIYSILSETGLPAVYDHWEEGDVPDLPYLVFRFLPSEESITADDCEWVIVADLDIELYCDNKDFKTEKTVETVLKNAGFIFDKSGRYIASERLYETIYETEVIIDHGEN